MPIRILVDPDKIKVLGPKKEIQQVKKLVKGYGYEYKEVAPTELTYPPSPYIANSLSTMPKATISPVGRDRIADNILLRAKAKEHSSNRSEVGFENSPLYDYQRSGVRFLKGMKRVLCADEVGLGKTAQSLLAAQGNTLVLTRNSLLTQWGNEVEKWLGNSWLPLTFPNHPERNEHFDQCVKQYKDNTVFIVNHESLLYLNEKTLKKKGNFCTLIVDEAHYFKNRDAKRSNVLRKIAKVTPNVYLLTGTPQEKSPADLWHLLHVLDADRFPSYWRFFNTFVQTEINPYTDFEKIIGAKNVDILHDVIRPYYLRRTRKDELPDVQEAQVIEYTIQPTSSEVTWSDRIITEGYIKKLDLEIPSKVVALNYLRQVGLGILPGELGLTIKNASKLEALKNFVNDNPDEKIVIFTSFRRAVDYFCENIPCAMPFYGGKDIQLVHDFLEGKTEERVLIATPESIGTGTNMQSVRLAAFADLPWNSITIRQVVGRFNRIGQKEQPLIFHFIQKGGADELISMLLKDKYHAFDSVVITSKLLNNI